MALLIPTVFFCLALSWTTHALVCLPDFCKGVECQDVDSEQCLSNGGRVRENSGFCSCCPKCITQLGEGDNCRHLLRGVPESAECGEGLFCHPTNHACVTTTQTENWCFVTLVLGEPTSHGCQENEICHPNKNLCVTEQQFENELLENNRKCLVLLVRGVPTVHGCRENELCHPQKQVCISEEELLKEIH